MKTYAMKAIDHDGVVHSQVVINNMVYTNCGQLCGTFKAMVGDPTTCKKCLDHERKAAVPV